MSDSFTIRPATLPLAAVLTALHAESFGTESWSCDQMRGSLALTTTKAFAAFEDEKPSGFILYQITPEETEILTFCVAPARRRQRIGEMLLRFALNVMRNEGNTIFLEVAADNVTARNLYEKLGFRVSGTRANYYKRGAVLVDAVMYELNTAVG